MDFFRLRRSSEPTAPPELVLAYLEEAQRTHAPCFAVDVKDREYPLTFAHVEATGVTAVVEGSLVVRQGGPVRLRLYLDELRFEARAVVTARRDTELWMELPHALDLDERRIRPRAVLKVREPARATLLTGLFEGKAVSGLIENVSEGGLRVQLSQALSIKRQVPIALVEDLLLPGEFLPVVRIDDLPRCPSVEVAGKVVYVQARGSKLYAGVAFEAGQEKKLQPVKEFVEDRTEPIPRAVPKRERTAPARPPEPAPAPAAPEERAEPRTFARLPVGSDYRLRFRLDGAAFERLPLAELSASGCTWRAAREAAPPVGAALEALAVEHPDLPVAEFAGRVEQVSPVDPEDPEGDVLVQAAFVGADPRIRTLIDRHVLKQLALRGPKPGQDPGAAQRRWPRLLLGEGYTARFRSRGASYTAVTVADVSAMGCALHMPREQAQGLEPGTLLALFKFDHPDLPSIPFQAQVVRVQPRNYFEPEGDLLLGVEFVNVNERVRAAIHTYVLNQMGCQPEEDGAPLRHAAPTPEERARHPKLSVGPEYTCSFRINGVAFQDQPLSDLSALGCGFRVDAQRSGPFHPGAFLQALHLHHPDLPRIPMQGCVSRVIGKIPGRQEGFVLVALDFVNLNERLVKLLQDHVIARLRGA